MKPKIERHNNLEPVDKRDNKANLNNQQVSQTENREIFSKGEVGKNLNHKALSGRGVYFEQYNGLKNVDDSNKKAILNILSEDYKNMTSEEKSHVPEYFSKIFEHMNGSLLDKALAFLSSIFSSTTKAKIVAQVEINGQHFDIVECGGGGDCCFRSIAEALGIGSDNYKIVRELLSKKMIEAADSEEELPETIRLALSGVYDGLNSDDDNMCKKALKHHAQNITAKNGRLGYQLDVLFVPQLTGKNVFIGANAEDKDYSFDGFDAKFKGLIENSIPEEGDVILYNVGKGHWQMLKPMEKSLSNKI